MGRVGISFVLFRLSFGFAAMGLSVNGWLSEHWETWCSGFASAMFLSVAFTGLEWVASEAEREERE